MEQNSSDKAIPQRGTLSKRDLGIIIVAAIVVIILSSVVVGSVFFFSPKNTKLDTVPQTLEEQIATAAANGQSLDPDFIKWKKRAIWKAEHNLLVAQKDFENAKMLTPNDKREAALDNNLSIVVKSIFAAILIGIAIFVAKKFSLKE